MATATITMNDALFAQVQQAAGADLSAWVEKACWSRLFTETARAQAAWERTHPAEAAEQRAAEAAHYLEIEAEREAQYLAEEARSQRGGDGDGPTAEERAAAERRARELFERADRRLREREEGEQ
ncbi:hypothetical protein [Nocardia transvalensis]|uniref:hypothetical protein n=1 Tax=Nocardia transvalensis TaxID=37333 RepID=UPI001893D82E|nr:hypothetical protein [Nocardia transvalensis]MBF6333602.1 hypothetical protein [Nocardia transvalensis]